MTRNRRPIAARKRVRPTKPAPPKSTPRARTAQSTSGSRPIPERGLKIGEAAARIGVETYVLRFWETQFPFLKPKHTRTRHRFYHARDLEVLSLIKRLLHREGFTIAGANKHIRAHGIDALMTGKPAEHAGKRGSKTAPAPRTSNGSAAAQADGPTRRVLSEVRRDLENLQRMLRG
ncbi:MAG TPA: MerR family transcriptional regulator [Candidatus Binataceae bacterium]|nr:MerR family transcriptional regulator [Candidatus Binataceae bacterium]